MPPATAQPTIPCPNCGEPVRLTDALAAPLVEQTRLQYEQRLKDQQSDFERKELQLKSVGDRLREQQATMNAEKIRLNADLEAQKTQLAADRQRMAEEIARQTELKLEEQLRERMNAERKTIAEAEAKRAQERLTDELAERDRQQSEQADRISRLNEKLAGAQAQQAALLKRQEELEEREQALKLSVAQEVQGRLEQVRASAAQQAEERLGLLLKDKERALVEMNARIEELQRRAQVGSQQAQGETLELMLEGQLKQKFPFDLFEPVAKGESGADILQIVRDESSRECGRIIWELKRTKNWSPGWIPKLKTDQRNSQADLAVLISQAMPPDIQHFNEVDGVWVSSIACTLPVASAMRTSLLQLGRHRRASEGQQTKSELIYAYLTGPQFRARLGAIAERWKDMRDDLEAEKKFALRQWAKREKQLEILLQSTAGIDGDLQGIAGREMPEIEALTPTLMLE